MALRTGQGRGAVVEPEWLSDDVEEDLVGSSLHQMAITTLYDSLRLAGPERGRPWCVGNQLTLVVERPDGTLYRPSPDILVHSTAGDRDRDEFDTRVEGAPALIVEVVSPTTWRRDIDRKAAWYAYAGVQEYFVFDPTGDLLGARTWAQRLTGRRFARWAPASNGRWVSEALDIALDLQGTLVRVYDQGEGGALVPTVTEQARQLAAHDRVLAAQQQAFVAQQEALAMQQEALAAREQALVAGQEEIARLQAKLRLLRGGDADTGAGLDVGEAT